MADARLGIPHLSLATVPRQLPIRTQLNRLRRAIRSANVPGPSASDGALGRLHASPSRLRRSTRRTFCTDGQSPSRLRPPTTSESGRAMRLRRVSLSRSPSPVPCCSPDRKRTTRWKPSSWNTALGNSSAPARVQFTPSSPTTNRLTESRAYHLPNSKLAPSQNCIESDERQYTRLPLSSYRFPPTFRLPE